ncbi:hypothetical protein [Winogradskyella sediminis]|uniref:hypothetical protein n=1 Tax=Winogradskyella sediminis TaxID=1382466 RepID=UPI000E2244C8|nr:hypothetical protein [Winogradskyella sediminis]REG83033.1 hypothetical protein C8N41_1162 [Winogradskyella sediminis]
MTHKEAEQKANELTKMFKSKYSDIVAHVDLIEGTDEIIISFFWNRISVERWNDAQTFKCKDMDYQKVLEKEIIPFFK